ncbi:hypothetical protein [Paraburkholderia unamae]|uniref:Uncharacterized protein n=1 Tax=Paraburkholderia unamae TaxID=219649 RepID=A0ACC6RQF3_9BURK
MMFVFLFPVFQLRALRAVCRRARMLVAAAALACLHGFAFAAAVRATPAGVRRRTMHVARGAAHMAARGALRTVHAGQPLTPTGYVLLGATVAAAALVWLLCASACACTSEPERPLWRHSRFA